MTTVIARRSNVIVIACFALLQSHDCVWAEDHSGRDIAKTAMRSVVLVTVEDHDSQPLAVASGFFVRENIVATNLHVIERAANAKVKSIGSKSINLVRGVVATDSEHDLALLEIENCKSDALATARNDEVSVGDPIYVVGNPEGLEGTFSQGIVSGIRTVDDSVFYQITAPISPGSSGGPVLNGRGEVIGIAFGAFANGQNLNFAIPSKYLEKLRQEIGPAKPLAQLAGNETKKRSFAKGLGDDSASGVACVNWENDMSGDFSFSVRNNLARTVKNVRCRVILYGGDGGPIHFEDIVCQGPIPASLAVRIGGKFPNSIPSSLLYSVAPKKTTAPSNPFPIPLDKKEPPISQKKEIEPRVEMRVIDFQVGE